MRIIAWRHGRADDLLVIGGGETAGTDAVQRLGGDDRQTVAPIVQAQADGRGIALLRLPGPGLGIGLLQTRLEAARALPQDGGDRAHEYDAQQDQTRRLTPIHAAGVQLPAAQEKITRQERQHHIAGTADDHEQHIGCRQQRQATQQGTLPGQLASRCDAPQHEGGQCHEKTMGDRQLEHHGILSE